jgi:hypothetical protein
MVLFLLGAALAAAQPVCLVEGKDTAAIQSAIDACAARGGGLAYVPPGDYTITTVWLKDNVELHIPAGARLLLDQELSHWPKQPGGPRALVRARAAKNIAITGAGAIDGQARYSWGPALRDDPEIAAEIELARKAGVEMNRYRREGVQAYLMVFENVDTLRIEGLRLLNSPLWTIRTQDSNRVSIRGIYLYTSLEKAVNGDGIDLVSTSNVIISDSEIVTGDDSICLKTTSLNQRPTGPVKPTENVVVTNCILSSSSTPLMIGTETHADTRHVVFSNIVIRDSNKAFGINVQDGATVSDVRYSNVTFELNRRHWNWWGSAEMCKFVLKRRTPESPLGRIENITIDGAQGTARGTSLISGHSERPLKDITLRNVRVRMLPEGTPDKRMTHGMVFERVDGLRLHGVEIEWTPGSKPDGAESFVFRGVARAPETRQP